MGKSGKTKKNTPPAKKEQKEVKKAKPTPDHSSSTKSIDDLFQQKATKKQAAKENAEKMVKVSLALSKPE